MTLKNLKKISKELEKLFAIHCNSLDASTREAFQSQINGLSKAIDQADDKRREYWIRTSLDLLAILLNVSLNVDRLYEIVTHLHNLS